MKNEWELSDYEIIKDLKNEHKKLPVIAILLIVIIIIVICKFKFYIFENQSLLKEEDNYLLILPSKKIPFYGSINDIYINQKKYNYEIINIDSNYTNINNNIYQNVYIRVNGYKTDSIITECSFLKDDKTLFQKIVEFITGGKNDKTR